MAGGLYQRSGWSSQLDTSPSCYILDYGVSGEVLVQYTTSITDSRNIAWMNGMTTEEVVQRCKKECLGREDCQGIQVGTFKFIYNV